MFTTVLPQYHASHKAFVDPFISFIKDDPRLRQCFRGHKKATFILTQDEAKGIYGGALLVKERMDVVRRNLGKGMAYFIPKTGEIWTCTVYIQAKINDYILQYDSLCASFYRQLYGKLIEFGMKEGTTYLWMILLPVEYLSTEHLGFWPYVFQVRPQDSLDGLFHGILSLTINPSKLHQT
ncbi:MAG: hypothetical protein BGO67_05120 [Alphaproteobacteria bacterium 41-28]|nr:MAG: hypothetical protein BGO67_05120 [Alphaproteobacteria bacterium 41-28]